MMAELRELYQEVILDHNRRPRNFGKPATSNRQAEGNNPLCGDRFTIYLTVKGGRVDDAHFEGKGCAISTASASMMTEMVKGKTEAEVRALFDACHHLCTDGKPSPTAAACDEDDLDRLQVLAGVRDYPMRVKCATLAWHSLNAALTRRAAVSTEDEPWTTR